MSNVWLSLGRPAPLGNQSVRIAPPLACTYNAECSSFRSTYYFT
jgi:hypothetical protein